jgi:hypothetical protein
MTSIKNYMKPKFLFYEPISGSFSKTYLDRKTLEEETTIRYNKEAKWNEIAIGDLLTFNEIEFKVTNIRFILMDEDFDYNCETVFELTRIEDLESDI